jgi:hypothetical protein
MRMIRHVRARNGRFDSSEEDDDTNTDESSSSDEYSNWEIRCIDQQSSTKYVLSSYMYGIGCDV